VISARSMRFWEAQVLNVAPCFDFLAALSLRCSVRHKLVGFVREVRRIERPEKASESEALLARILLLSRLVHASIARIYEVFADRSFFYLVSECIGQTPILGKLREVAERSEKIDMEPLMKQILSVAAYTPCKLRNEGLSLKSFDPW
jgi:hypothetical protein